MLWFLVTLFLLIGGILLLVFGLGNVDWAYQDPDVAVAVIFLIVLGLAMLVAALVRIHASTKTGFEFGPARSAVAAAWEPLQERRTRPAVEVQGGPNDNGLHVQTLTPPRSPGRKA